jgi:hypothetical protein
MRTAGASVTQESHYLIRAEARAGDTANLLEPTLRGLAIDLRQDNPPILGQFEFHAAPWNDPQPFADPLGDRSLTFAGNRAGHGGACNTDFRCGIT